MIAAGQGLEAAEMVEPFGVGEGAQADALGPALVAVAQDMLRELRRLDLVEEVAAERGMGEGRAEVGGNGHALISGRHDAGAAPHPYPLRPPGRGEGSNVAAYAVWPGNTL